MNLLHLKYAIEVEKTASINKAAENLFMGQPNLSRAIKDLEESLGLVIFKRTTKGMLVTPQGEAFLTDAKKLIQAIDQFETIYKNGGSIKQKFSISVPRASYIAAAFAEFAKQIDQTKAAEVFYKETNASRVIQNILQDDYHLGIIRYQQIYDDNFKTMLRGKGLHSELISEFNHIVLVSKKHPLADKATVDYEDLRGCVEVAHADHYVPSVPTFEVQKEEYMDEVGQRIFVFERASQLDLLQGVPNTFMWASPLPHDLLEKYGLVEKRCMGDNRVYKDVLIYRDGYVLTELDHLFVTEVCNAKRKFL